MTASRLLAVGFCIELLESRIAPAAIGGVLELPGLNGTNGFTITGEAARDYAGVSVSEAGDVNGDGFGDVLVGAFGADPHGFESGATYVVFGSGNGFPRNLEVSTLDGSNGFKIEGEAAQDRSGNGVSAAGDFNGDGIGDLLIGAPQADPNGSNGRCYIVFGSTAGFPATVELSSLNGVNGFQINGETPVSAFGDVVSGAGDLNGDGFGDILIGARNADPTVSAPGATYVIFGAAGGFGVDFEISRLDGSNGFRITGEAEGDQLGYALSAAGDVNGDGFDDFIVGAPTADPKGDSSGVSYVIFGKATGFPSDLELRSLNGSTGFTIASEVAGDRMGSAVSGAGDFNGDGFDDLLVGALGADPNGDFSGATYLIFGKAASFPGIVELSTLDGVTGFQINGEASDDLSGAGVAAVGDFNGDGFDDVLIASPFADSNGGRSGRAYVVYGRAFGFGSSLELSALDGGDGFKMNAESGAVARAVSTAGDVNGDGLDDLLIGSYEAGGNGEARGRTYVVFGVKRLEVVLSPSGKKATFIDVDGDVVKVKTDRGVFTQDDFALFTAGQGGRLEAINLAGNTAFAKATISVAAATPAGGKGNGRVDVGNFDATGVNLSKVTINGDLGQIGVGDGVGAAPALKLLKVGSLGARGLGTQGGLGDRESIFEGDLGKLSVGKNIDGAVLAVNGQLGTVAVGADLTSAKIIARGILSPADAADAEAIGSVKVAGAVTGSGILAGYTAAGLAFNPDASIGAVLVKGAWRESDLVAGVADSTGDGFGRNDAVISGGSAEIMARIAKVNLKGGAFGSSGTLDHFGITAETIGKIIVASSSVALSDKADDVLLDNMTGDFRAVDFK